MMRPMRYITFKLLCLCIICILVRSAASDDVCLVPPGLRELSGSLLEDAFSAESQGLDSAEIVAHAPKQDSLTSSPLVFYPEEIYARQTIMLGGDRKGGELAVDFKGDISVTAGLHTFRIYLRNGNVLIECYSIRDTKKVFEHTALFDEVIAVGRKKGLLKTESYAAFLSVPNDMMLSANHFLFTIRKNESGLNHHIYIKDLGSHNGIRVDATVFIKQKGIQEELIVHNLQNIFSEKCERILFGAESPGPLSLNSKVKITGLMDSEGRIVAIGRREDIKQQSDIIAGLSNGSLFEFSIHVTIFGIGDYIAIRSFNLYFYQNRNEYAVPEAALEALSVSTEWAKRLIQEKNPQDFFASNRPNQIHSNVLRSLLQAL